MPKRVLRGGGGIFFGPAVSGIVATAATLGFSTDSRITASEVGITSAMRLRDGFPAQSRIPIEQLGTGFGAVSVGHASASSNATATLRKATSSISISRSNFGPACCWKSAISPTSAAT